MLIKITIQKDGYKCGRCSHEWLPRTVILENVKLPLRCPGCNSPYWNTPRRVKKVKVEDDPELDNE